MHKKFPVIVLLAAAAWSVPAAAQNVYRCGGSYSQNPCPGGIEIQADDARTASQRSQTSQAAQRDAKAADAMQKARLKDEGQAAKAMVMPVATPAPAATENVHTAGADRKVKKPAHFTAIAPKKAGETQVQQKKKKAKKKTA